MKLKQFDGQKKSELSMIEVAHAIFEEKGEVMDFSDLLKEVVNFLDLSDEAVNRNMTQFYTDLNIDGSFISLGENRWGLRSWYPIDAIDEETTHANEDETPRRKKRKKAAAFDEEEVDDVDYEEEDMGEELGYDQEDDDDDEDEDEIEYGDRARVDVHGVMVDEEDEEDLGEYKADLSALGTDDGDDDEDDLPDGVEGDLTIIDDDEEENDDEDDEEYKS